MGEYFIKRVLLVATLICTICVGCRKGEKDAGNKVGEGLTKFVSGIGQGIDKELMVEVELSKEVTDLGISKTVSKQETLNDGKGFSVYFIASKAVESTLIAKAYNADDLEIGRTTTNV
ncbi:MAG TPA: hypothetical protein VIO64_02600 [Pseudobacteroides sp.]|uniref:hypothetical protein n=1 Tax=Pseudobacteroides sp. TaxID=1968840 RepID=UPI002F93334E